MIDQYFNEERVRKAIWRLGELALVVPRPEKNNRDYTSARTDELRVKTNLIGRLWACGRPHLAHPICRTARQNCWPGYRVRPCPSLERGLRICGRRIRESSVGRRIF